MNDASAGLSSVAAQVEIRTDDQVLYSGEAIYRPRKPHPTTGAPAPMIGVPDDAMKLRPSTHDHYQLTVDGRDVPAAAVYLERVSTCWWFVLESALP
jgi:hypothetical protein